MTAPAWTTNQRARAQLKLPALYDAAERAKDLLERMSDGRMRLDDFAADAEGVVHDITDIINEIDTGEAS